MLQFPVYDNNLKTSYAYLCEYEFRQYLYASKFRSRDLDYHHVFRIYAAVRCNLIMDSMLNISPILNMMNHSENIDRVSMQFFSNKKTNILAIHQMCCRISCCMDYFLTCRWMNLMITSNMMDCSATHEWVSLTIASDVMDCLATHEWVNLTIASATHGWVNLIIASHAMACSATREWVNFTITSNVMFCPTTREWVNLTIASNMMDSATYSWVNPIIAFDMMDCSATRERMNSTITSNVMDCLATHEPVKFTEHTDINNQHDNLANTFSSILIDMKKYRFPPTTTFLNDSINTCFQHIDQCDENNTFFCYHYFIYLPYKLLSPPLFWSNQVYGNIMQLTHMLMTWEMNPYDLCRYLALCIRKTMMRKHDFLALKNNISYHFPKLYFADFIRYLQKCSGCIQQFFRTTPCKKTLPGFVKPTKITHNKKTQDIKIPVTNYIGGGNMETFEMDKIKQFELLTNIEHFKSSRVKFVDHLEISAAMKKYSNHSQYLISKIPINELFSNIKTEQLPLLAQQHELFIPKMLTAKNKIKIKNMFMQHREHCCDKFVTIFEANGPKAKSQKLSTNRAPEHNIFPPNIPDATLRKKIINDFCEATNPSKFQEAGCAVCGALTVKTELFDLASLNIDLSVLNTAGTGLTRKERKNSSEPISELDGPTIDTSCHYICISCRDKVRHKKMSKFALARGLWLGEIPEELQQLSFAEKLLIGRVRHNRCVVRVAKGMHKMIANCVAFEHPMQKIYTILPPPIEEMDEVLAFIFTGPCQPTNDDFRRIPLLVR